MYNRCKYNIFYINFLIFIYNQCKKVIYLNLNIQILFHKKNDTL